MQFHVPQFIDVEDKIIGSLSAKQFAWVGGGVGAFFIAFTVTKSIFIGLILASPFIVLGLALAFYKVNDRPFIHTAEAAFKYGIGSRLYIWKKTDRKPVSSSDEEDLSADIFVPNLSDSKLKDLAWSLDIQESKSVYPNKNQQ